MSAPPSLPVAPKEYDQDYVNRLLRILTMYFTQVGQDVSNTAGSTINSQLNSLGVGVAASGTAGDIKATTVEATTFTGALAGNAGTATNATNLTGSGTVSATATGGAGLTPTNAGTAATVSTTIASGAAATTQAITDSSTKVATTAWVKGLFTPITASLGADVALNNTANYFDGPSVAQGTAGIWFVFGTVCMLDTAGGAGYEAKLWDGTTLIASGVSYSGIANGVVSISLMGFLPTAPVGNFRISVKDRTNTTGKIVFNNSGNSKDSTITAIRIG